MSPGAAGGAPPAARTGASEEEAWAPPSPRRHPRRDRAASRPRHRRGPRRSPPDPRKPSAEASAVSIGCARSNRIDDRAGSRAARAGAPAGLLARRAFERRARLDPVGPVVDVGPPEITGHEDRNGGRSRRPSRRPGDAGGLSPRFRGTAGLEGLAPPDTLAGIGVAPSRPKRGRGRPGAGDTLDAAPAGAIRRATPLPVARPAIISSRGGTGAPRARRPVAPILSGKTPRGVSPCCPSRPADRRSPASPVSPPRPSSPAPSRLRLRRPVGARNGRAPTSPAPPCRSTRSSRAGRRATASPPSTRPASPRPPGTRGWRTASRCSCSTSPATLSAPIRSAISPGTRS